MLEIIALFKNRADFHENRASKIVKQVYGCKIILRFSPGTFLPPHPGPLPHFMGARGKRGDISYPLRLRLAF
jgi:hypothetical protein